MEQKTTTECTELSMNSPPVILARAKGRDRKCLGSLSLFQSIILEGNAGIAFAGGHISVLKWHPEVRGVLATAAHRSDQTTHEFLKTYSGAAHIQLWSVINTSAKCLGVVEHDGDCTWDVKWRPGKSVRSSSDAWSGTFAAALGDGCILICRFHDISRAACGTPSSVRVLPCSKTVLRESTERAPQGLARVVEWSLDGKRLLVGTTTGAVEVFESSSSESVWPKWSVPAQESIVTDIRWVNRYLFCTLGIACVLRLRDIRDPVATLEQNAEGLAGSRSMCILEPNVAAIGGDSGYLRVVRLYGTDNFRVKYPVRKVFVQKSSFRTMQSVSAPCEGASRSLIFTGGCEGIVHEVSFPRPLWLGFEECRISKTKAKQILRWGVEKDSREEYGAAFALKLNIGSSTDENILGSNEQANNTDQGGQQAHVRNPNDQRKTKVSGPSANERPLFGTAYHQSVVITRVDVNLRDRMIAVGIDGGIITWMPVEHETFESSLVQTIVPSTKKRKREIWDAQEARDVQHQIPSVPSET